VNNLFLLTLLDDFKVHFHHKTVYSICIHNILCKFLRGKFYYQHVKSIDITNFYQIFIFLWVFLHHQKVFGIYNFNYSTQVQNAIVLQTVQGCQMVYKFWVYFSLPWNEKCWYRYFMSNWTILRPFGIHI
jgi:hypothetical protein